MIDGSITWPALIGGLTGATVSGMVALVTPVLNQRLERKKLKFSMWQAKRVTAAETIYSAFCDHVSFLWQYLYFYENGGDVTPLHNFRRTVERNLLYFDNNQAELIASYEAELLRLWNSCITRLAPKDEAGQRSVQETLEKEIPLILPRLRADLVKMVDPYGAQTVFLEITKKAKSGLHGLATVEAREP